MDNFSKSGSYAEIEVRADGVYIIVNNTETEKVSRRDVLKIIEDCQLKDVDFSVINGIFKDTSMHIEVKITENTDILVKDEEIVVEINKDGSEAYIKAIAPGINGKKKTYEQIMAEIAKSGVKYGLDKEHIKRFASDREYNESYLIARAKPCVDGADGYLEYKFDIQQKTKTPKLLDSGNVDFHDLDIFEIVYAGETLVVAHPHTQGEDGINVLGQIIPAKPGKPAPKFRFGKNVAMEGNEERLVAKASGQIVYNDRKVSVSPVLEISGDVGIDTGDINFNGSVIVRGNVLSGYSVVADDVIEIMGSVEGAVVTSNVDVKIYGGVHGLDKAVITSGGSISVKFAEGCTLIAQEHIYSGNVMHSNVSCGGELVVDGKKGMLVGGKITVGRNVRAKIIGSTMATLTEINIGSAPRIFEKYEVMKKELAEKKEEFTKLSLICESLIKLNEEGKLGKNKKDLLLKTLHSRNFLKEKIIEQRETMNEMIVPWLGENKSAVYASNVIRSGVRILIGGALLHVRDDIYSCRLTNKDGKVMIDSYTGG